VWRGRTRSNRDHLTTYWNALNRDAAPEELARLAEPLDQTVIAAIDRPRALHRRRRPDPAFATRLEHTIMDAFATFSSGSLKLQPTRPSPTNGRTGSRDRSGWLPSLSVSGKRRRWLVAQLATAVLIIIAILGFYLVLNNNNQPATPPPATPTTTSFNGWTNYKGDASRRGEANAGPVGQPMVLWRYQAGGSCLQSPAAVGDTIYAACGDGLHALNAVTGTTLWEFPTYALADGPTVAGDLVYVVDNGGILHAIDINTQQERWNSDSAVAFSPVVDNGLLAMGTPDGALVGFDAQTGEERWRYQATDQGAVRGPALAGGIVYAGGDGLGLVAVDAETGELRWRFDAEGSGTAVIADGVAYAGATAEDGTGHLYAFDAQSGDVLWTIDEPIGSPAVSNGVGYTVNQQNGSVLAFDTTSGTVRWRVELGGIPRPLAVAGSVVYAGIDEENTIYALDIATGAELWRLPVDGAIDGSVAVADGVLYVNTVVGSIYAIGGTGISGEPASPVVVSPEAFPSPEATPSSVASPTGADTSPVEFLWQTEGGSLPFEQTGPLTIAPEGQLWVADSQHGAFQIFGPDGTFVEKWGVPGSAEGQFNFVSPNSDGFGKIAFAPDGTFYVADTGNQRVQHFAADRTFLGAWGTFGSEDGQFISPLDVAVDAQGNVFVNDNRRGDIQKFDADGKFLLKFGGSGSGPGQLDNQGFFEIDAEGNVWVADPNHNRVEAWDNDGNYLTSWGEDGSLGAPIAVTFDSTGRMFLCDAETHRVQVLDADGTLIAAFGTPGTGEGQFMDVMADIAVDGDGNVYVGTFKDNPHGPGVVQAFRLLPPLAPEATPTS
jgi:outer membrane protein assembly factor BamB